MAETFNIRKATEADAVDIAKVHVLAWQETYRGQIPDDILDAADFTGRRAQGWARILHDGTDDSVVAESADRMIVGFATAGPSRDDDLAQLLELTTLYTVSAVHGSNAGQSLLDAIIGQRDAFLWVAAKNPRAQAFYLRNGFRPDGAAKNDGIDEIRMVRRSG